MFSGFNKKGYMDNSKYLYEYVLEHYPEIQAVWLTLDKAVFERLTEEGKPVMMMRTKECRRLVARASIGGTDHFRMSDYDAFSGLNDRLKIVQLWHGVGLKTIGDLKNTNVPGVVFSDDILPREGDGNFTRRIKKIKYFRHAYYRELFEKYFMLVCPGQERWSRLRSRGISSWRAVLSAATRATSTFTGIAPYLAGGTSCMHPPTAGMPGARRIWSGRLKRRGSRLRRHLHPAIQRRGKGMLSAALSRKNGWILPMLQGKKCANCAVICPGRAFAMRISTGKFKTFTKNLTRMLDRVVKTV